MSGGFPFPGGLPRPRVLPRPPPEPTSYLGALYQRYFGTPEARSVHLHLLLNTALFATSVALIAWRGDSLIHESTKMLTPAQAQSTAQQPLAPPPAP